MEIFKFPFITGSKSIESPVNSIVELFNPLAIDNSP
jgi:hypothetical protein